MPEPAGTNAGKGARVLGFFLFQLGAGVILDSAAHAWGAAIAAVGLMIFVRGIAQIARTGNSRAIASDDSAGESTTC